MKQVVTFGEVMMRLSPPGFQRFSQTQSLDMHFGGCEANVSLSLAQFGQKARHITRFPDNELGKAAIASLQKNGVDVSYIQFQGDRLGLYFLENGTAMRAGKIIYDRYHSAFAEIEKGSFDWETILEDAAWFHWSGITPALSENCAYELKKALEVASQKNIYISADIYYRSNLWKYGALPQQVMPELTGYCHLILASEQNLVDIYGVSYESGENSFVSACRQMQKVYPRIQKIVDTERISLSATHNRISAKMWNGSEFLQTSFQDIQPITDRIGGGDAFMAGLIYGLLAYKEDQKALNFGICASALKHTFPGDVNLATVEEVEKLMEGDSTGRLKR